MEAFTETRDAAVPEVVRTAWQRTLDGWSEPERHDELLRLVGQHSAYAWVAGRYRDAQREHPADTIGERQLDRVRRAAEATLFVSATPRPDKANKPYQSTVAILVVLVLLMAIGLGYALVRDNTTQAKPAVSQPLHP
ncbi:MAG: hypothetical protein JWO36_907 [Myxococcales bacterium]|nr:hypothetical protein [Myxococcales bacterium]